MGKDNSNFIIPVLSIITAISLSAGLYHADKAGYIKSVKEIMVDDENKKEDKREDNKTVDIYERYKALSASLNESYDEYVTNIAELIKNVSPERKLLKDFALYTSMLESGAISLGDFEYSVSENENYMLLGATVASGDGVCRNIASNFRDVLRALGYNTCYVSGISFNSYQEQPDSNNHGLTYANDGEKEFLLDPTNNTIFLKGEDEKYISIHSTDDLKAYFIIANSEELSSLPGVSFEYRWDVFNLYDIYKKLASQYVDVFLQEEPIYLEEYEKEIDIYAKTLKAYHNIILK